MAENSLRTQKTQRPGQKREQRNKFKDVKYIIRAWINNAMIYRKMFSLLNLCRWFLEVLHLVAINLLRSYRFPTTLRFLVFFSLSFFAFCHFLCGCHQSHQSHEFLATLQLFRALEFVARSSSATIWHLDVCIVFFSCF